MTLESLYRRIIGDRFDDLPTQLREFHDIPLGITMNGTFDIKRGRGWIHKCIASLGRLPQCGTGIPLRLEITVVNDREIWHRQFGSDNMKTVQWQQDNLLIEAGGPMRFGFEIVTGDDYLQLLLKQAWFCRIPVPRFLLPIFTVKETATPDGLNVEVSFAIPFIGEIIQYNGQI